MEQPSPHGNNTKSSRKRSRPAPWWKVALIVSSVPVVVLLGLILVILVMIARNPSLRRTTALMSDCGSQLTSIGAALNRYELNHGAYPRKLEDLCPDYLPSRSVFRCPADKRAANAGPPSYEYRRPQPKAPDDTIVCVCRWHRLLKDQPPLEIRLYKNGRLGCTAPGGTGPVRHLSR